MKARTQILSFLTAVFITFLLFVAFRIFLSDTPGISKYASEIAAALLGGIVTIIITGILLHKQSEVELNKERNVKILDTKINIYGEILENLENIIKSGELTSEDKININIKMQLLYQKLVQIASLDVLKRFQEFLAMYKKAIKNNDIDEDEIQELLKQLLYVNTEIRIDIASVEDRPKIIEQREIIKNIAEQSLKLLDPRATHESFLESCDDTEKDYYVKVFEYLDKSQLKVKFGVTGFSINGTILCYPTASKRNIELIKSKLNDKIKSIIANMKIDDSKQRISLSTKTLPVETFLQILDFL